MAQRAGYTQRWGKGGVDVYKFCIPSHAWDSSDNGGWEILAQTPFGLLEEGSTRPDHSPTVLWGGAQHLYVYMTLAAPGLNLTRT